MICKYISECYLQCPIYLNSSSNKNVNQKRIVIPSKIKAVAKIWKKKIIIYYHPSKKLGGGGWVGWGIEYRNI